MKKAVCKRCEKEFLPKTLFGKAMSVCCPSCMVRNLSDFLDLPTPPELLDKHTKIPTLTREEFHRKIQEEEDRDGHNL